MEAEDAPPCRQVKLAIEVEVKEKKDRVDDALNATRAAVEEGITSILPNFAFHRVGDSSTVEQRTLLYSGGGGQALSG